MIACILWLAFGSDPLADIGLAPAVELIDASGKPFALESLRGKAVIVSFVYTTCNGTCPLTTAGLDRVRRVLKTRGLWAKRVEFVSISLDPARDTPEVLRKYAATYRAEPASWHFLTGDGARVRDVLDRWDMWARPGASGQIDHPSRIFLIDPRGHTREIYSLETLDAESVADDVASVLESPAPARPAPGDSRR